jgi:multiple sugar transport system permease protein
MERGFLSNTELRTSNGRAYYFTAAFFLIVIAIVSLFPFFFAFTSGLKNSTEIFSAGLNLFPQTPLWGNYSDAWTRFEIPRLLGNSFLLVGGSVLFRVLVSAAAAYSLSHLKPVGGRFVMMGFLLTLMIPGIAYIVPLYLTIRTVPILNISLLNTPWGLWLPYAIDAFSIFVLKTFFDNIPSEIVDSARVDGASPLQIFRYIVMPLSTSILMVIAIVSFVNIWKDYLLPLLVINIPQNQPITVRLITIANDYGINLQMAAAFMALVPPLLIAIFLQRYMQVGITFGSVKG